MQSVPDGDLLDQFARTGSEPAFGELVRRYLGLVHSVARRHTQQPQHAEEISQAVFIILARKAATLGPKTVLSGWLYHTARLTAANFQRAEFRRVHREQEAYMSSTLKDARTDLAWLEMAPLLDEAMGRLGPTDRDAVVLRYFENKNLSEVGAALGLEESAAQKRVQRALEKLRKFFTNRGVTSTTVIIAGAISDNSVQAAPEGLAHSVTTLAVAKGAAAGGSTLTLVKGALNIMARSKANAFVTIGLGALLITGTITTGFVSLWFGREEIGFEVEGTVTYATIPRMGNSYTNTMHFIMARAGNVWKIRTTTLNEERTGLRGPVPPSVDLYYEMGCDGKSLFTLDQQKSPHDYSGPPAQPIFALGRVETAVSPPGMDRYLFYPVWLAYGADAYFQNLGGARAVSPLFPNRDFLTEPVSGKLLPANWSIHGKAFLEDVSWFNDGTNETHWPDGKITMEKELPPFENHYQEGHFEVLSWTNYNGLSYPKSFQLTFFRPAGTSQADAHLETAYTVTGTLEQIRKTGPFSPVPELKTRTAITDTRLTTPDKLAHSLVLDGHHFICYVSTNRWDFADAIR